jgi:hypothetical protein
MSIEDYQVLTSIQGKEELQLVLPARDVFSDDIRVLITNSKFNLNISLCSGQYKLDNKQRLYEETMCRDPFIQWL